MAVYKDGGHGITERSLGYWDAVKSRIGKVTRVEAAPVLLRDTTPDGYPAEYSLAIYGVLGTIYLSGCNCGYHGEGPHGTAKILIELGMDKEFSEQAIGQKHVHYDVDRKVLSGW